MSPPRLFISYSWSSEDHEFWVIELATMLRESGIDVILDKWELKEGHDSIAFMEKVVTDSTIRKVAIISDRVYAEKADSRKSGVGTETQLISREVYEEQGQSKFVAVLPERDRDGKPFLPAYYKGRIYIDLSSQDSYALEFERLLRWVFDKPLHTKPEIGPPPAFLHEDSVKSLGTSAPHRRAVDALKNGRSYAEGAVDEYLTVFAENLERFRIVFDESEDIADQIADSIEQFTPYKNEFVQLMSAAAQYAASEDMQKRLHRFFEHLLPYFTPPKGTNSYHLWDFDNFKFIVHELYLHALAILIRHERFDFVNRLVSTPYYLHSHARTGGEAVATFAEFQAHMESFENRSRKLRRTSTRADLLKERAEKSGFDFQSLMQADFILYLRGSMGEDYRSQWWPETLLYASPAYGPMEVFARSRSKSYYGNVSKLLGGIAADDLKAFIANLISTPDNLPRWRYDRLQVGVLSGMDKLSSAP